MADYSRLPAATPDSWAWQTRGACRDTDVDPTVFFHPEFERAGNRATRTSAAKAVCGRCPALEQCREHALTVQEPYGTWGGLDELERTHIISTLRSFDRATA